MYALMYATYICMLVMSILLVIYLLLYVWVVIMYVCMYVCMHYAYSVKEAIGLLGEIDDTADGAGHCPEQERVAADGQPRHSRVVLLEYIAYIEHAWWEEKRERVTQYR
jgi:hypothetical protein